MPCYNPLSAWKSTEINKSGKRGLVFKEKEGQGDEIQLPCGRCIGCRLERSRQWALRCMHEASLHDQNCFITLTYDPENLPATGSLIKSDFQKFFKRLRKRYPGQKIRYYMCGEYGHDDDQPSGLGRPHFHACVFNFNFADRELFSVTNDIKLDYSPELEKIWGKGFCTVGDLTFDSAAYVARYVMKKITGEMAEDHYQKINYETGEINQVIPEYTAMSRRPGIAHDWYREFKSDLEKDFITKDGQKMLPPKYYDYLREQEDPDFIEKIKQDRKERAMLATEDNTYFRLRTREEIKERQISRLQRDKQS